jgi:hypothetical protein
MKKLFFLSVLFFLTLAPLKAQPTQRAFGWCEQGGQTVSVPGNAASTTKVQRSYPQCTVTVYLAGTLTIATIYSDAISTPLANPFTSSTTGLWYFYANTGTYDVKFSGGGISTPFTIPNVTTPFGGLPGSGTVTSVATTAPITGGTITTTGTIACATCTTNASALTANLPVIGAGSQAAAVGTRSGNTTAFVTTTGSQTSGRCVEIDANGNHIQSAAACGTGTGTVVSGTAGQMAYYPSTTASVSGNANVNMLLGAMTLGQAGGVLGQMKLAGNTSGTVTITPAAAAGTWDFTLPAVAGTNKYLLQTNGSGVSSWVQADLAAAVTGTLPVANGGTGLATITTRGLLVGQGTSPVVSLACASGWIWLGQGAADPICSATPTLGLAGTTTGKVLLSGVTSGVVTIQPANAAGTWSLTLPTSGGTNLQVLATNGSGVTSWVDQTTCPTCVTAASTLTANNLLLGGGSRATSALGSLGTTTQVLHGNAAGGPTWSAVSLTADVTGTLPVANGGTGAATLTGLLQGTGTTAVTTVTDSSTVGQLLRVTGASAYGFGAADLDDTDAVTGTLGVANGGTNLASGTSGGILAFTGTTTLASSGALTANLPVIGGGAGVSPTVGTRSGNTTAYVTTTGSQTSGNCVSIDASGNHIANGSGCLAPVGSGLEVQYRSSATALAAVTGSSFSGTTLSLGATINVQSNAFWGIGSIPSVATCGTIGTGSKNAAGFITSNTTGSCVSVLTFNGATAATGWSCGISNGTTANILTQTGSSTTTATFTGVTVTGDILRYVCMAY